MQILKILTRRERKPLTPKQLHNRGECRKFLLGYTCHGRNDYAECN